MGLLKLIEKLEALDFILGTTLVELPGKVIHASVHYDGRALKTWPKSPDGSHQGCLFSRVRSMIKDAGWEPVLCGDNHLRFEWLVKP